MDQIEIFELFSTKIIKNLKFEWTSTEAVQFAYQEGAIAPIDCNSGIVITSENISGQSYTFKNLTSGQQYSFRMCTKVGSNLSNGITQTLRTYNVKFTYDHNKRLKPSETVVLNGSELLFVAYTQEEGLELWKTNGTTTQLVKDIFAGPSDAEISNMITFGTNVLFSANDGVHGPELWLSDGTSNGTYMVKDIHPGEMGSKIEVFGTFQGKIIFIANDGVHGNEPWITDGTTDGTHIIKDTDPGDTVNFFSYGNIKYKLPQNSNYFVFKNSVGNRLWKSDGTESGTVDVAEVNFINDLYVYGDDVLTANYDFLASGVYTELYMYDDSAISFSLLKNINTSFSSSPNDFYEYGGKVYFSANGDGVGFELYQTDGSTTGTILFKDIYSGASSGAPGGFFEFPSGPTNLFFFAHRFEASTQLWESDGTSLNTTLVKDFGSSLSYIRSKGSSFIGSTFYFILNDFSNAGNSTLWKSDGTTGGTVQAFELNSGGYDEIQELHVIGSNLYFYGFDGINRGLFKSDGTLGGTSFINMTAQLPTDSGLDGFHFVTSLGSKYLLSDSFSKSIILTDGTEVGTSTLSGIYSDNSYFYSHPENNNSQILFPGRDSAASVDFNIYYIDNTFSNYGLFHNSRVSGDDDFNMSNYCFFQNKFWYIARNGSSALKFYSNSMNGSNPVEQVALTVSSFKKINETQMLTFGTNGSVSNEPYINDGTNYTLLKDINPSGSSYVGGTEITELIGKVYFTANDGTNGNEVWVTDMTTLGTYSLGDLSPGVTSAIYKNFVNMGGFVYFIKISAEENALYKTDGTPAGTELVYSGWVNVNQALTGTSQIFINAVTASEGKELWVSDGTNGGTHIVKDINIGTENSLQKILYIINDEAYFTATTSKFGTELWKSDGSESFTHIFKDFCQGTCNGFNNMYYQPGLDTILIFANDAVHGEEMWTLNY